MENAGTTLVAAYDSDSAHTTLDEPDAHGAFRGRQRTITLLLPLLYNPNKLGIRFPVGLGKIRRTIAELKREFSGFTMSLSVGWCKEDVVWDLHLRVESDLEITPVVEANLLTWKMVLQKRFHQRSIFAQKSPPVDWV